jgi:hypothetical protein
LRTHLHLAKGAHLAIAAPALQPGAQAIVGCIADSGMIGATAVSPERAQP